MRFWLRPWGGKGDLPFFFKVTEGFHPFPSLSQMCLAVKWSFSEENNKIISHISYLISQVFLAVKWTYKSYELNRLISLPNCLIKVSNHSMLGIQSPWHSVCLAYIRLGLRSLGIRSPWHSIRLAFGRLGVWSLGFWSRSPGTLTLAMRYDIP